MRTSLYRSRTDRVLGGVCGGLAHTLGVAPLLVRLSFVLLAMGGGAGVILYVVLWLIISPEGALGSPETMRASAATNATILVGLVLLVFGVGMLLRMMGMHWFAWMHMGTFWPLIPTMGMHWFAWMPMSLFWPLLLIVGGVALLLRRSKER